MRPKKTTTKEVKHLLKEHLTPDEIAERLKCSVQTVYNRIKDLKLSPNTMLQARKDVVCERMLKHFCGLMTTYDIAKQFSTSIATVRKKLRRAIDMKWEHEYIKWPRPKTLAQYRVFLIIKEYPGFIADKDINSIWEMTGVYPAIIKEYLARCVVS